MTDHLRHFGLYWEGNRSPTSEEREVMAALGHIRVTIGRVN